MRSKAFGPTARDRWQLLVLVWRPPPHRALRPICGLGSMRRSRKGSPSSKRKPTSRRLTWPWA
eukprot:3813985-Pyramimonas_sp.AAC.1